MNFDKKDNYKEIGSKVGYIITYFIFTTILYFIFILLNKLPDGWNYFYVMALTISIVLIGTLIKWLLK